MTRVPGSISGTRAPEGAPTPDSELQNAQQTAGSTRVGVTSDGVDSDARTADIQRPDAAVESGRSMSAELIAQLEELLTESGTMGTEVADFADAFFEVADTPKDLRLSVNLSDTDRADAESIVREVSRAATPNRSGAPQTAHLDHATSAFEQKVEGMFNRGVKLSSGDINALVQWVLRESYLETTKDLNFFAEKVKFFNRQKKAIREHVARLRQINAELAGLGGEGKNVLLNKEVVETGGAEQSSSGDEGTAAVNDVTQMSETERNEAFGSDVAGRVARYMSYAPMPAQHRTPLEDILLADETGAQAREDLLSLVPMLKPEEIKHILAAIGGKDMKVHEDLWPFYAAFIEQLSAEQMLELQTNPDITYTDGESRSVLRHHFADAFQGPINELAGRLAAEYGMDFKKPMGGWDFEAVLRVHRDRLGQTDHSNPSMRSAIRDARESPSEPSATSRLVDIARESAGAAPVEDREEVLAASVGNLSDRLSAAQRPKVAVAFAALEDAESSAAESEGTEYPGGEPPLIEESFDLDPTDGEIDQAFFVDEPPFIRKHPEGSKIRTKAELEAEITNLEERLSSVGDDAQLANIDLQNMLQKQQQTVQLMSNISKMLHDTALAMIRKFG